MTLKWWWCKAINIEAVAETTKRDDSLCEAESKTNAKRFLNVCLAGEGREEAKLFFFSRVCLCANNKVEKLRYNEFGFANYQFRLEPENYLITRRQIVSFRILSDKFLLLSSTTHRWVESRSAGGKHHLWERWTFVVGLNLIAMKSKSAKSPTNKLSQFDAIFYIFHKLIQNSRSPAWKYTIEWIRKWSSSADVLLYNRGNTFIAEEPEKKTARAKNNI